LTAVGGGIHQLVGGPVDLSAREFALTRCMTSLFFAWRFGIKIIS
jgi:hypothetical protein